MKVISVILLVLFVAAASGSRLHLLERERSDEEASNLLIALNNQGSRSHAQPIVIEVIAETGRVRSISALRSFARRRPLATPIGSREKLIGFPFMVISTLRMLFVDSAS